MTKEIPKILIGTSGWSYEHWKDNFYPQDLPQKDWLHFYGDTFSTVEINNTFYHLPLTSSVKNWYDRVPNTFLFSVKASRYITHMKRLNDCNEGLKNFFKSIEKLGSKTGPILFQLPPSFSMDKDRLEDFIKLLSDDYLYTFEFRHKTWFVKEIYELLAQNNIALCITDLGGKLSPTEITSNFAYIRLHGPKEKYKGSYGTRKLQWWKTKMLHWKKSKISTYCYFDNDEKGFAIQDAKTIKNLLQEVSQ